jgi:hypothetical protein
MPRFCRNRICQADRYIQIRPLRAAASHFARRIFLIGAAASLASLALAAEPKPDAAIKNKTVDANVFLDDKIKADTALSADCLAEGKSGSTRMPPRLTPRASKTRSCFVTAAGLLSANTPSVP